MRETIPAQMHALQLEAFHEDVAEAIASLQLVTKRVPVPGPGQVLVKIEAAPCNPSDLLFLQARYAQLKTLPSVPGWEGAGTVVAKGGGWIARWLQDKRVACSIQGDRDGTWGQYVVANALECIPLKSALPIEQGASLIINPLSAMGLLDTARRDGHRAAVHTAGASQLGRMLLAIGRETRFPLIHVVRRAAQVELLQSLGAQHVLDASEKDFAQRLRGRCRELDATAAFEAVAGEMTGIVLQALPPGSTVYLYGALSEKACSNINPIAIIFERKSLTGFFLASWVARRGRWGVLRSAQQLQRMIIERRIETSVQRSVPLHQAIEGLQHYVQHMTAGKVLIRPHY